VLKVKKTNNKCINFKGQFLVDILLTLPNYHSCTILHGICFYFIFSFFSSRFLFAFTFSLLNELSLTTAALAVVSLLLVTLSLTYFLFILLCPQPENKFGSDKAMTVRSKIDGSENTIAIFEIHDRICRSRCEGVEVGVKCDDSGDVSDEFEDGD